MPRRPTNRPDGRAAYLAGGSPLAYLITFRCYGTWLHGDPRGSVDREHNTYGTPFLSGNTTRESWAQQRMRDGAVYLDPEARAVTEAAVTDQCRHRGWGLAAVRALSNHVHLVVSSSPPPERVLSDLKARATRCLVEGGHFGPGRSIWAERGSTRYLWTEPKLDTAVRYVLEGQDAPRPPHPRTEPEA